jgi:hypothetical protein
VKAGTRYKGKGTRGKPGAHAPFVPVAASDAVPFSLVPGTLYLPLCPSI